MLTGNDIEFLTRMGERLLGVLIGGMSVLLGYRLFARLPDRMDSAGKLILPGGISIYLSRVGPGVFFALFGAGIVASAFTHGVSTSSHVSVSTTEPGGVVRVIEEKRERRGVGSGAGDTGPEAQRRVAEARTHIFTLNREWPLALRKDLHADDRKVLEVTRDYSKSQILRAVWQPGWGSPSEFDAWLSKGPKTPPPASIAEPARIYLDGLEPSR